MRKSKEKRLRSYDQDPIKYKEEFKIKYAE